MEPKNARAAREQGSGWLGDWGLGSVLAALLDAVRPLAPVGAGLLWMAQPALGALVGRDRLASWAGLLEDPEGLERLCARLAGREPSDASEEQEP